MRAPEQAVECLQWLSWYEAYMPVKIKAGPKNARSRRVFRRSARLCGDCLKKISCDPSIRIPI